VKVFIYEQYLWNQHLPPNLSHFFKHKILILRYQIEETGFNYRHDRYGMNMNFDQGVQATTSHLTLEPFTFLARIGGVIGVGQTLTWVINLCFVLLVVLLTNVNEKI